MIKGGLGNKIGVTISSIYLLKLPFIKVAKGAQIIWQKFTGCFSSGFWKSELKWNSNENWKN